MALILGMKPGYIVTIGNCRMKVLRVKNEEAFVVAVEDEFLQETIHKIGASEAKEIAPSVMVSAGVGHESLARVVIDAPKEIEITREW